MKSKVAIAHNADIEKAIHDALNLLDLSELFNGKHVAIKPNETWASKNDLTACTQADSVKATIQYVKRYNTKKVTVTGGAGAAETDEVFKLLGIDKVIKEEDVEFFDHNRPPFKAVKLEYGPQDEVMVNPHIFEYDTLVSLAQHKVHGTATVTLTMKNIAMSYSAADYYGHPRSRQVHAHKFFKDMHGLIFGMCQKFPIDLGIIVGHPAMIEKGPIGGKIFESELAIASTDFVAADAVGAKLLGFDRVRHIVDAAEKFGLGTASLDDIEIVGIPLDEAIRIFNEKVKTAK